MDFLSDYSEIKRVIGVYMNNCYGCKYKVAQFYGKCDLFIKNNIKHL